MREEEPKRRDLSIGCSVIYDLLPLYIDGICSEESRSIVEEHLTECPDCRKKYEAMTKDMIIPQPVGREEEAPEELIQLKDRSAVKILRRIRRRWLLTLMVMALSVPLIWLSVNQYRGEGLSFTNMYDYYSAGKFVALLERGEYEKAFGYIDVAFYYKRIQQDKQAAYSSTINREEYQLVEYADGIKQYTNGVLTIPADEFEQWLVNAKQELIDLREWFDQSPYKDMTYDEFYTFSKKNFIRHLQDWKVLGYTLKGRGVANSYAGDSGTVQIDYRIRISKENNKGEYGTISLRGNGAGKFVHSAGSYTPGDTMVKLFTEHFNIWD